MAHIVTEKVKFDFNDILIKPSVTTDIISRQDINPFYDDGNLPLFTAPMDTVINEGNEYLFNENKFNICLPRENDSLYGFNSHSLSTFKKLFLSEFKGYLSDALNPDYVLSGQYKVLIDMANGHMLELIESVESVKKKYGEHVILMVGNVANSETYVKLSNAGADYIRIGIGNGGGCLTSQQLGVGYPMGSLIRECFYKSLILDNPAKIVADGGMKTYSDIIKALALGADYVMIGNILNKTIESAGDNYLWRRIKVSPNIAKKAYSYGIPVYKKFRGMSTKEVQQKWGVSRLKTSEGVVKYNKVEYTVEQWVNNFKDYLCSAMSYTNSSNLNELIGNPEFILITDNAYKRFNK